ncbi:MAG: VacJ family lipoprotein [Gammaproteobacteria bacterium]|nr:VacJ family lipoprotein [Gammaproteobacteria bacterium]
MKKIKLFTRFLLITICLSVVGCACVDPLEPVNRQIFAFNMVIDKVILRPVATVYDKVMPPFVACRIGNFFDNIDDITNIANNTLQFKLLDAWSDCWRFAFNTTFGVFGLFDVATCAGLPKHHQDFGLTLARYGFVNSTYLMVPFFGPSTIRDTIGWSVDWHYLSLWPYIEPPSLRYGLYGLRIVHKRAALLPADRLIDEALDPYLFVRDAYLQKRDCDIRAICPGGDSAEPGNADKSSDGDDTFVGEEGGAAQTKQDDGDTFVGESDEPASTDAQRKPPTKTSPAAISGDPFVEP